MTPSWLDPDCPCLQGMLVTEMWLDRVARTVGKPLQAVRELNLYSEGDKTHYGQVLNGCQVSGSPPCGWWVPGLLCASAWHW